MSAAPTFNHYMRDLIKKHSSEGHDRLAETYRSTLNSFERFLEGRQIRMGELTPGLLEEYQGWLWARRVSKNTSSFYMRILRATFNRAVDQGYTRLRHPFKQVYTGVAKTQKRALRLVTLRRLKNLDLTHEPHLAFARDLFLFSFYTRGMSFVDIAFLRPENISGGTLHYCRRKTGQPLSIGWEPCMQEIIDRYASVGCGYLLPVITDPAANPVRQYRTALFKTNKALRTLSTRMNLPNPITTYSARHSWASIAYSRNVPLAIISEGMGHSSERTTRIYLNSLDSKKVDKANRSILNLL